MRRLAFSVLAASCFVLCLVCLFGPIVSFAATLLPDAASRSVTVRSLLVDLSVLPSGWQILEGPFTLPKDLDYGSNENAGIHFQRDGRPEIAQHYIFRFHNTLAAWGKLSSIRHVEYSGQFYSTGWAIPTGWTYHSPIADDFQFACATAEKITQASLFSGIARCTAIARYDEYVSVFSTPVSDDFMGRTDIESILRDIDQMMTKHIKQQ